MESTVTESIDQGRDGLESWIRTERPGLVRTAYSILRNHEEAEDVVQETLLAILRQRPNIRRLGAYVTRAVYWNALKHRARRRPLQSLESVPEQNQSGTENRLYPFELERAVAGLPPAQQTVIRLRFYLGLSFDEIAKNLSISINTAASRCRYGLANLGRVLRPAAKENPKGDPS
jgi:RNA polymerase sigma-70 factor (ECF subfamily)